MPKRIFKKPNAIISVVQSIVYSHDTVDDQE